MRLTNLGWFAKKTHGNAFQSGFPDIFACKIGLGHRWIEVKLPGMIGSYFTPAQLEEFPKFERHGSGVWILTGDDEEQIRLLYKKPNLREFIIKKL